MATALLLQRDPAHPTKSRRPDDRVEIGDDAGGFLVCAACLQAVTTMSAKIEMAGSHAHSFANPIGIVYHVGCFAIAPGCGAASEPRTRHTWFPGYAWQIVVCRGCGEHLGWLFLSGDSRFHALIFDRLATTEGSGN